MDLHQLGLVIATLALLVTMPMNGIRGEDWPRWGGPRGDETWQGPPLPEKWPEAGLKVAWSQSIGGGYAGVVVADGRVFVADRVQKPREVERLLCFDAASGRQLWVHASPVIYGKLDYGNGPRAAPTVYEGRVYTLGAVGRACCLNAADGALVWEKNYPLEYGNKIPKPTWGLAASPVIWNDLAIFHPGAENDGCLIALDRVTGEERWRASSDPAGYATPIVIDAPSGPQLVAWTPENVLGVAPRTGEILWSVPYKVTFGVSIATPIYYDKTVFVTGYWEGSRAITLGPKPGDATLAWQENRFLRGLMTQPLYRDRHVYMIDRTHGLTCFELSTGRKLWDDRHQVIPRGDNPQASLVWLGESERVIILNALGELILARMSPAGFVEQSRTRIIAPPSDRAPIWAHPAYAGTRVFARSDSELVCIELQSSEQSE